MPKIKTKKTILKRIRITRKGKILKKNTRMGHLKIKFDASRKSRKSNIVSQDNKGHIKVIRKLVGKHGKGLGKK